jgi:amino acid transporter
VAVSNGTFVVVLTVAASLLALWIDLRLPKLAPASLKRVLLHVVSAFVALQLFAAVAATVTIYVALFGIVLPLLTYAFLTGIWFIRIAQSMLASGVR